MRYIIATAVSLTASSAALGGFTYSTYTPAQYDSNDPTSGWVVEDLEDDTLAPGLGITVQGHSSFTRTNVNVAAWDGQWVLHNVDETPQDGRPVTFSFANGVTSFGVGISHLESGWDVYINGSSVSLVDNLNTIIGSTLDRNGYLTIMATGGDLITSVHFAGGTSSDSVHYDHIAWAPSPGAAPVLAIAGLAGRRRRR